MPDSPPVVESVEDRFERLLREYGPSLSRLVSAYERDPHEREDLLQEIAFAIWKSLPRFRGDSSERTFIYRIAHNRAITHSLRTSKRRTYTDANEDLGDIRDPRPDQASQLLTAEQHEMLLEGVRRLSPLLRETMVLSLEGMSNDEIGAVVGTRAANVAVRLTRARAALSSFLSNAEER
jgi:RNA polymerase sigma-70 factor (ECF subfamily)